MRTPHSIGIGLGSLVAVAVIYVGLYGCKPSSGSGPAVGLIHTTTNLIATVKTNVAIANQRKELADWAMSKSFFEENPKNGRDPFFPKSLEDSGKAGTNTAVAAVAKPSPESLLELNSVVGSASMRLASINGRTFLAGEEKTITTSSGTVRVRCIEVNTQSVTVEVNGRSERKILNLSKRPN